MLHRPSALRALLATCLALPALPLMAAEPSGWSSTTDAAGIPMLVTPGVDAAKAIAEDRARFTAGGRPHFAVALRHAITPATHGQWRIAKDGTRQWRLALQSPKALSLNFGFARFQLPPGAELRILDEKGRLSTRPFTAADNEAHGELWTPIFDTDTVTLELRVPAGLEKDVELQLSSVNHGYRQPYVVPEDFAKSGSCNVDVACAQADGWRDPIRSVGAITVGGVDTCTGALINNSSGQLIPYFLTAAHCSIRNNNAASVVVYWNYQNSTCRVPGSGASGSIGDGSFAQFNSGALHRATSTTSDFTLLELDDAVDPAFDPHWAGWDARDIAPTSAVAIHHPGVEEKRISFENDPTSITTYSSDTPAPAGTHIRIADWDVGTTEGGSSGSPLFNADQRIVGQLHGGAAACGNDEPDWYGRLFRSWTGGGSDSNSLQPWLDPANTATVLDGRDVAPFKLFVEPAAVDHCILGGASLQVDVLVERSDPQFAGSITLGASGQPVGSSLGFSQNPVVAPATSVLTLGNLAGAATGEYSIALTATSGGGNRSLDLPLALFNASPGTATLVAPANGATAVATAPTFSWNAATQGGSYLLEVDDDPAFATPEVSETVDGTSFTASGLDANRTYSWRVVASNACGDAQPSTVYQFTTAAEYCASPGLAIPDGNPTGASHTINVPAGGALTDLDVRFAALHGYSGDLAARLTHVASGTTVILLDRPGVPASTYGCTGNSPVLTFDDEAAAAAETSCRNEDPAYLPGAYRAAQLLSAFDGLALAGEWRLTVSDAATPDAGTLQSWCLVGTVAAPPSAALFQDGFED